VRKLGAVAFAPAIDEPAWALPPNGEALVGSGGISVPCCSQFLSNDRAAHTCSNSAGTWALTAGPLASRVGHTSLQRDRQEEIVACSHRRRESNNPVRANPFRIFREERTLDGVVLKYSGKRRVRFTSARSACPRVLNGPRVSPPATIDRRIGPLYPATHVTETAGTICLTEMCSSKFSSWPVFISPRFLVVFCCIGGYLSRSVASAYQLVYGFPLRTLSASRLTLCYL